MPTNFAVRLRCPHGDTDSWVTLPNRKESVEQILQQTWEFNCREHGPQRGIPREAMEIAPLEDPPLSPPASSPPYPASGAPFSVPAPAAPVKKIPRSSERLSMRVPVVVYGFARKIGAFHEETETITVNSSGALVALKTRLELGDTVFLIHKGSRLEQEVRVAYLDRCSERDARAGLAFKRPTPGFWRKSRKKPRIPKTLRVLVKGIDSQGHPFAQTAYTIDLSKEGARLDGVGFLTAPGKTLELRCRWRKARFRVIWIGQLGSAESNQVGLFALDAGKNIWRIELPDFPAPSPQNPHSSKK